MDLCRKSAVVLALQLAYPASAAIASDFEMSLQVKSATQQASVKHTEESPSPNKPQTRPVFTSEPNETLVVTWTATNNAKETYQDVLIHCLVVAEKEPGQAALPSLKDTVQESALTMDFKPGDSAKGEFSLAIDAPGAYLVRVETRNMLDKHHHEHYVALDLVRK
jgi:hypothetical protein